MAKNGTLTIDGEDIFTKYGVVVSDGGLASLVQWPSLKEVESNDWFEEDGLEADLSAPRLASRDVEIPLSLVRGNDILGLLAMLGSRTFHEVYSPDLGMTFRLRYVSCGSVSTVNGDVGTASVTMADDFPLWNFTRNGLASTSVPACGIIINLRDLSAYGVRVLQGTVDSFRQAAESKTPLTRDIAARDGLITDGVTGGGLTVEKGPSYDNPAMRKRSRSVTVKCLMSRMTAAAFAKNWRTLLYDLTRPDGRTVTVAALERSFRCYYSSCSVERFYSATGGLWCEFTLTIVITGGFRLDDEDMILATEDGIAVYTEDDEYAINVRQNRFA